MRPRAHVHRGSSLRPRVDRAPRGGARAPPLGGGARAAPDYAWPMSGSPLDPHAASPRELRDRIAAERSGAPFLIYRTDTGDQVLADLEQSKERITIGRRAGNDVALEWDARVSRVHAALERVGEAWVLMDDGLSHNGTWVNGERLTGRR